MQSRRRSVIIVVVIPARLPIVPRVAPSSAGDATTAKIALSIPAIDSMMNESMRLIGAFLVAAALIACGRAGSSAVTLQKGKAEHVHGCNVLLDDARVGDVQRAFMHFACGAPESAIREKQWWGDGLEPPGFTIDVGDCMPLEDVYYCLEGVVHEESATFKATYKKPKHPKGNLQRIP